MYLQRVVLEQERWLEQWGEAPIQLIGLIVLVVGLALRMSFNQILRWAEKPKLMRQVAPGKYEEVHHVGHEIPYFLIR